MKKRFVIGINGMSQEQEKAFGEYLTKNGYSWWHRIDNFWLLIADNEFCSVQEIRDLLKLASPGNDIIVVEAGSTPNFSGFGPSSSGYFEWIQEKWKKECRIHGVSATLRRKTSAGVLKPKHFLGLLLSHLSMVLNSLKDTLARSVFLGKWRRTRPIVFSTVPFSQLWKGAQKKDFVPSTWLVSKWLVFSVPLS